MNVAKTTMIAVMLLTGASHAMGQIIKDPTKWTYEAKRKFGNHFELFFHVQLADKWHIYALNPGTAEGLIPPSFTFTPDKDVKMVGKMKEQRKPVTEKDEVLGGTVSYFKTEATFVQEVEVPWGKTVSIKGKHEYQVCNDRTCLPPKTKDFSFSVKP